MATSGIIYGTYSGGSTYKPYLKWERTSYSTSGAQATSTIKVTFGMRKVSYNSTSYNLDSSRVTGYIGNKSYSTTVTFDYRNSSYPKDYDIKVVESAYIVTHNTDGTASVNLTATHNSDISLGTGTVSGTAVLDTLIVCTPASISIGAGSYNYGGSPVINITKGRNNDNANCKYVLTYNCNNTSGNIVTIDDSIKPTSYNSWQLNVPALIINNKNAVSCSVTLTTYWNNNKIADNSASFLINLPSPASGFSIGQYTLLTSKPEDWDSNKTSYYKLVDNQYISVESTDTWASDIYYEKINYFDSFYSYSFTDNSSNIYTYQIKIGETSIVDNATSSGGTFKVGSQYCTNAMSKSITLTLVTMNGNVALDNPETINQTFNIPLSYKPNININDLDFKNMYNDTYFFNGSRQSSIDCICENLSAGSNASIVEITCSDQNIEILGFDTQNKTITIKLNNSINAEDIDFTVMDSRNQQTTAASYPFPAITVLDYIPLHISNVKVENEYKGYSEFYVTFTLSHTNDPNQWGSFDGSKIDIIGNPIETKYLSFNNNVLKYTDPTFTGSILGKNLYIKYSLYGESVEYSLYLSPQEKALNLNPRNKIIRVGGLAGDLKDYELLTSQPTDWNTNYTDYFKIVNGAYEALTSVETYAANTYYKQIQLSYDTWGLVVDKFDLTLTDNEIAILKAKFNII